MNISPWKMTEDELLAEILGRCEDRDLWAVRVAPERINQRIAENNGFPDLVIYGPGGIIHRELKTAKGRYSIRPAQTIWKHRLLCSGQDWAIWTPVDLDRGRIDKELDDLEQPDEYTDEFQLVMSRK